LLDDIPELQPIALLDHFDTVMLGKFGRNHLRTLQRKVNKWLATKGLNGSLSSVINMNLDSNTSKLIDANRSS